METIASALAALEDESWSPTAPAVARFHVQRQKEQLAVFTERAVFDFYQSCITERFGLPLCV